MGAQAVVTGELALVTVTVDDVSTVHYFYKGAVLPDGVEQDEIDHLVEMNLVTVGGPAKQAKAAAAKE